MELQERYCPICEQVSPDDIHQGCPTLVREFEYGPRVKRCSNCNLVFLNPVMTQESYKEFYSNDEQKDFVQSIVKDDYKEKVSKNDMRRAELITKHINHRGKILDIGTGRSNFVGLMGEAVGIDISEKRIAEARERGQPVMLCDIYEWQDTVDTVTLFHVLEHILDPNPFLKRIHDVMSHHGHLVIEVPNLNDALVGLKAYEKFYYQNAHCSYFTPSTLSKLLNQNGFVVKKELRLQRYSLDNHMNWLLKGKPGKINSAKMFNSIYSWAIKKLNTHDTIFLICKKG